MMALIFAVLLAAVLLAWKGARKPAIYTFAATLILSVVWFLHHVTSHLNIDL
jgi:uncharacterized membrane protein